MRPAVCAISGFLFISSAAGQELLWTVQGVGDSARFTHVLDVIGDMNHDAYEDFMVVGSSGQQWFLWFLSGRDGSVLRRSGPYSGAFNFSGAPMLFGDVGAGDMDGDSVPDYAMLVNDGGSFLHRVQVRSGRDDHLLWEVLRPWGSVFGYAILGNVDLDGDGVPDLLVGDQLDSSGWGAVHAFGPTGQPMYISRGVSPHAIGRSLARVGDVDNDHCDDFVTGGWGGADTQGRAVLISGRTGTILRAGFGELQGDQIGYVVTGCGDIDRDGVPDFAAGNSDFATTRGVVRVFSGRTAQPLYTWTGRDHQGGNTFGSAVSGGVDVDRDGVPDVLVGAPAEEEYPGAPQNQTGAYYVFSGRDGTILRREGPLPSLGFSVQALPPHPGSPFGIYLVSEPWFWDGSPAGPYQGRIRCYRGTPRGVVAFGAPGRGTLATEPKIGLRDLGAAGFRIHLSDAESGAPAALVLGISRTTWAGRSLPLSLTEYGFPGCSLFVSMDAIFFAQTGTSGVGRGYASLDLPWPLAYPGGFTLYGQWISFGTGSSAPGGVSDALEWRH